MTWLCILLIPFAIIGLMTTVGYGRLVWLRRKR